MKNEYKRKFQEVIDKIGLESAVKIAQERLTEIKAQPQEKQDKLLIEVYEEFITSQTKN
jgi:vacuolar-type H+-ATPase subunit E/Vma4